MFDHLWKKGGKEDRRQRGCRHFILVLSPRCRVQQLQQDANRDAVYIRQAEIERLERLNPPPLVLSSIGVVHVRDGNVRRKVLLRKDVLRQLAEEDLDQVASVVDVDFRWRFFARVENSSKLFFSCRRSWLSTK